MHYTFYKSGMLKKAFIKPLMWFDIPAQRVGVGTGLSAERRYSF